ncbi:MAG: hypothetical protein JSR77_01345 [Planctomycetes bacterium]|nr:hypothetical protein [Planctomycetota bacterium]
MSQTRMLVVIAGAALGFGASAFAQTASNNDRAYAAEMVSDAGARTSLLADGGAGYDAKGFMIGSADGNNTLYVFGSAQIRYNADFRDDSDPLSNGKTYTGGFENNLTRIGVHGTVWDKALSYQVRGEFGSEGSFGLETAFGKYTWDNGFAVQFGQFKHPLFRESMIDNEYQLAVNRSITEGYFGGGYTQGVNFIYSQDAWRFLAGFNDGVRSANTPSNSAYNATTNSGEADYGLTARAEFKIMGAGWERFDDFTSWRSAEDVGLLVGAAIHWQDTGDTGPGGASVQNFLYTGDVQFEGKGWNAFGAFYGSHIDDNSPGSSARDDFGAAIQGGVFLTDQVEIFARWDAIFFDSSAVDDNHFITGGVNYYLSPESHAAKITADVIWALNKSGQYLFNPDIDGDDTTSDPGPFAGSTTYGLLGEIDNNNEFAFQLQFQIVF